MRLLSVIRLARMIGLAGVAVLLAACEGDDVRAAGSGPRQNSEPARDVKTARVTTQKTERVIKALGSFAAKEKAVLSVKVPGRVEKLFVDLGTAVQAGDPIAQLESADYELAVQQAEALLAQARARLGLPLEGDNDELTPENTSLVKQAKAVLDESRKNRERVRELSGEGILSQSELETVEANYTVALSRYQDAIEEARNRQALLAQRRVELQIARQQLLDTRISAPFDGVIGERHANLGEYLNRGAPVVSLVQINPLRLRIEISERDAHRVQAGQKVKIDLEGAVAGRVSRLSPNIDPQTRTLVVEADLPNPGLLRPGGFVECEIVTDDQSEIAVVPPQAILVFAGLEKIFLVQNGKAVEKRVVIGDRTAQWAEVQTGATPGDVVILNPGNLRSGQNVTVIP